MLALIMAGGRGTRLNMGEKPLVRICGRPMIEYVIDAFKQSTCDIVVVASSQVPVTKNWCRAHGIDLFSGRGVGYVEDLVECILELGESDPFFTCVSDLPCITPGIINSINDSYKMSGREACSIWVPEYLFHKNNCRTQYVDQINGIRVCPAGINILSGERITEEQDEHRLILEEPRLVFNVNTPDELRQVTEYIYSKKVHDKSGNCTQSAHIIHF